ncbi:MAG: mechanosensitive ion channel family protein [Ilumatobacter sp.]|uniref:mechanosensitive ion channel family protein n=1 Tax=Ilumatobacter sp. TaxID=1967498 RepID=UPI003C73ED4F
MFPRATDATRSLDVACGEDPKLVCEKVFDATNGNETVARIADWLIDRPLSVLLIIVVAWVLTRVVKRALTRLVRRVVAPDRDAVRRRLKAIGVDRPELLIADDPDDADAVARDAARRASRAASISSVLANTAMIAIWTIAFITVLGELGLNLGPMIAGAGIAGVALGFGAQSLVKDFISGLFMLLEDQFGIGDVVDLGEAVGTVEEVALRTTVLRGLDGTVWHVPNGEILRVGNKSQHWSTAVVDVDVAYDADLSAVRTLVKATAIEVCTSEEWRGDVLDEPDVLGVEMLGADGITVRMVVKTAPGAQWALQRALREALKSAFEAADIEIPFPQRTLWLRNQDS